MLTSCIVRHACACGTLHQQRHYHCRCGWVAISYRGAVSHVALCHHLSVQQAEGAVQAAIIECNTRYDAARKE